MERRAIPRNPVLMSGAIQFAGCAINCLVRDMTISGPALEVTEPLKSPSISTLFLRRTARTSPVTSSGTNGSGSCGLRLIPHVRVRVQCRRSALS
jgi:hypothetical protein